MKEISKLLLEVGAVKINPDFKNPFVFPSGMSSPIYCNCSRACGNWLAKDILVDRLTKVADEIVTETSVEDLTSPADVIIVSVGASAIGWGFGVANKLNTPFAYVDPEIKDYGVVQEISGAKLGPKDKVIVLEDLVATGGSALAALDAVRKTGAKVLGVVSILSFGWAKAKQAFETANVRLVALTNYKELVEVAVGNGYFTSKDAIVLDSWYNAPENWG